MLTNSVISDRFNKFIKEFSYRNEFDEEETQILSNRYKKTKIKDIPISWIISIDCCLKSLYQNNCIPTSVSQNSGFLVVNFSCAISEHIVNIIKDTEEEVYSIDHDLHLDLVI